MELEIEVSLGEYSEPNRLDFKLRLANGLDEIDYKIVRDSLKRIINVYEEASKKVIPVEEAE